MRWDINAHHEIVAVDDPAAPYATRDEAIDALLDSLRLEIDHAQARYRAAVASIEPLAQAIAGATEYMLEFRRKYRPEDF